MKKLFRHKVIAIICVLCIACVTALVIHAITPKHYDVYVSSAKSTLVDDYSEFDLYLKNGLDISNVPTYVIVNDEKVIGTIGPCSLETFESKLGTLLANSLIIDGFSNFKLGEARTINGSKTYLGITGGVNIIQVVKADCKACDNEESTFRKIRARYKNANFIRYYIRSSLEDAAQKEK